MTVFSSTNCYFRCGVALHDDPKQGQHVGKRCFLKYHDTLLYGTAFEDRHMRGMTRNNWVAPSQQLLKDNKRAIKALEKPKAPKKVRRPTLPTASNYTLRSNNNDNSTQEE